MTASDLIRKQLDESGYQLTKVFEGLDESLADAKAATHMMSPRETLVHLGDCYRACQAHAEGKEYQWGSYSPGGATLAELAPEVMAQRDKAIEMVMGIDTQKATETATSYIVLHDPYHVGQMCVHRLAFDPEWNAYSIYNM